MSKALAFVSVFALLVTAGGLQAKTLFEDDFKAGLDSWELIPGSGEIKVVKSDPPKYGPEVMEASVPGGTNCLAFVKDLEFTDGYIEVLWKDMDWTKDPNLDSDGPIFLRDQNGDFRDCYLIELDQDTGLHIAVKVNDQENTPPDAVRPDVKSTDSWTWMKVKVEGFKISIKVWDASEREPEEWTLEFEDKDKTWESGKVGIRVWSGRAQIAFYRVSDLEGPKPVQPQGKLPEVWGEVKLR